MSADTTAFAIARDAALRQERVRADLLGLLDAVPASELRARWRDCGVTIDDLNKSRKKIARNWHPDQHPGDPTAARRLAQANSIIDHAIFDLKRGNANTIDEAISP